MAEFLIYNKTHWMDKLSQAEWDMFIQQNPNWQEKYSSRYQRGDFVEARPDGFFTGPRARGFNKKVFRLLVVKGLKDFEKYARPQTAPCRDSAGNLKEKMVSRCQLKIDLPGDEPVVEMKLQEFKPKKKP